MYLIDASYFIREIHIPNVNESNNGSGENLDYFIDEKVRLLLSTKALGGTLFTAFNGYIVDGELPNTAPQKWKDLVNGKTYTKNDKSYIWEGLLQTKGTFKKSLLAYYTYYYWLMDNVSLMSGLGEVRGEAKNAIGVNSTQRLVAIWNEFVKMYQGENTCFNGVKYVYNGVPIEDYYNQNSGSYVSLLQFLKDNEADYPDAQLEMFEFQNQLGL